MNGFLHTAGRKRHRGFTLLELVMAMAVGTILTAIAVPVVVNAQKNLRLTSAVSAISGGISQTRYQSIMTSQVYTLTINAAAGTYVVTNVATGAAGTAIPYSTSGVAINGGSGTYTFLFCPNGTVWTGGATCPGAGAPPALTATYQNRQTNLNTSSVGNVTTVLVH